MRDVYAMPLPTSSLSRGAERHAYLGGWFLAAEWIACLIEAVVPPDGAECGSPDLKSRKKGPPERAAHGLCCKSVRLPNYYLRKTFKSEG